MNASKTVIETLRAWRYCCPDSSSSAYVFTSPQIGERLDNIKKS
jgi:hypothetical protein